jgi:hypothetical protein
VVYVFFVSGLDRCTYTCDRGIKKIHAYGRVETVLGSVFYRTRLLSTMLTKSRCVVNWGCGLYRDRNRGRDGFYVCLDLVSGRLLYLLLLRTIGIRVACQNNNSLFLHSAQRLSPSTTNPISSPPRGGYRHTHL